MPKLLLRISGLCAFVPKKPIHTSPNRMKVLLAEARGIFPPHGPHSHEHHEPVLKVPFDRVAQSSPRPPDLIFTDNLGNKFAFFLLADQDLTVGTPSAQDLTLLTGSSFPCPTSVNSESFEWAAPLQSVTPGSGAVIDDCLKPAGHQSIAARALLTRGTLKAARFARDTGTTPAILKWRFRPIGGGSGSGHVQALAEEVLLDADFTGATITLPTSRFRNGSGSSNIILRTDATNEVKASLLNMPWPDLLGTRLTSTSPRIEDAHFEHFYGMSQSPGGRNVPHPDRTPPLCSSIDDPHPSLGTPQCPPSRFENNDTLV